MTAPPHNFAPDGLPENTLKFDHHGFPIPHPLLRFAWHRLDGGGKASTF